jgi:hypothetical protein
MGFYRKNFFFLKKSTKFQKNYKKIQDFHKNYYTARGTYLHKH